MVSALTDTRKILYAIFTAKPGNEKEVADLIADLQTKVRQEPGNLVPCCDCSKFQGTVSNIFEIFQATTRKENPAQFFVYEEYKNEEAFKAHITADYGAVFNAKLKTLIVENGSQLFWLNSVEAAPHQHAKL